VHCSANVGAKTLIVSSKCYGIRVYSSRPKEKQNNNMSML
jgi:hypothetical protein